MTMLYQHPSPHGRRTHLMHVSERPPRHEAPGRADALFLRGLPAFADDSPTAQVGGYFAALSWMSITLCDAEDAAGRLAGPAGLGTEGA
jgi:hypothetical protein